MSDKTLTETIDEICGDVPPNANAIYDAYTQQRIEWIRADNSAVIQTLQAELEQVKRERDAARKSNERVEQAEAVVAAAGALVGAYTMQWHNGMFLVGRAEFENLVRALEPYREKSNNADG